VELPLGTKWFNVGTEVPDGVKKFLQYTLDQRKAEDARQNALESDAPKPKPWDEIQHEPLRAAMQTKVEFFGDNVVEFTPQQFASFGAGGVSLNSYIKAGELYFKPVRNIKLAPVQAAHNTHHKHRSRAMELHEKKPTAKGTPLPWAVCGAVRAEVRVLDMFIAGKTDSGLWLC